MEEEEEDFAAEAQEELPEEAAGCHHVPGPALGCRATWEPFVVEQLLPLAVPKSGPSCVESLSGCQSEVIAVEQFGGPFEGLAEGNQGQVLNCNIMGILEPALCPGSPCEGSDVYDKVDMAEDAEPELCPEECPGSPCEGTDVYDKVDMAEDAEPALCPEECPGSPCEGTDVYDKVDMAEDAEPALCPEECPGSPCEGTDVYDKVDMAEDAEPELCPEECPGSPCEGTDVYDKVDMAEDAEPELCPEECPGSPCEGTDVYDKVDMAEDAEPELCPEECPGSPCEGTDVYDKVDMVEDAEPALCPEECLGSPCEGTDVYDKVDMAEDAEPELCPEECLGSPCEGTDVYDKVDMAEDAEPALCPEECPGSPCEGTDVYDKVDMAEDAEPALCSEECPGSPCEGTDVCAKGDMTEAVVDDEPALCHRVHALEEELRMCQEELQNIQRQLRHSQKLHQAAESSNQELRRQVKQLRQEIHDGSRSDKVDKEVQVDDYAAWSDYYNYYYSSYENHSNTYPAEASEESQPTEVTPQLLADSETSISDRGHCATEEQETNDQPVTLNEDGISLAESLRATAEAALTQTGFTYDESSGMYYDHSTGFYYNSESQLYYDPSTGIYYYCDVESGRYQFHSKVDLQAYEDPQASKEKKGKKKRRAVDHSREEGGASEEMRASSSCSAAYDTVSLFEREESSSGNKKLKLSGPLLEATTRDSSSSLDDSEPEEGELTDSEKTSSDEEMSTADSGSAHNSDPEDTEQIWPPCIRVIVVRSPVLEKGSLFIITADKNATIGREKDMAHTIRISEIGVSKFHAEVYFDHMLQSYVLVDQGSQNGTVINGNQILQPKTICEPYVLNHGDEVKFGETVLSFHVHPGSETCDGCEPGQVRAHLRLNRKEEFSAGPVLTNKEEKELLRRKGLKKIREKYGLQSAEYEDNKVLKNPKYKDRAARRRKEVGSEGTFTREDAPASVHVEINESNKGRKMLEKMGWRKGEGLGKAGDGMRDPIHLQLRKKQAGLGTQSATSIENLPSPSLNKKNWEKARERYAEIFQEAKKPETKKGPSWVKSGQ
ncbi:angiogenic factor with G patch and FHA domains 1 [Gastrophryne carolinensis]